MRITGLRDFRETMAVAVLLLALVPMRVSAGDQSIVLVHDDASPASMLDCRGVADALDEAGMAFRRIALQAGPLAAPLDDAPLLVACDVDFSARQLETIERWVERGGGLLASGRSAHGLEHVLGLQRVYPQAGGAVDEVRFVEAHPVAQGSFWQGPMMDSPPTPALHQAPVAQLFYRDQQWQAQVAEPADARVLARWVRSADGPEADTLGGAITVHAFGQGRAVYSGALPGAYAHWEWPYSWRTMLVSSMQWLVDDAPLVSLGYWPDANVAAFSWTGDTETPDMQTAVPALLALFAEFGLSRFGTFYVTARGDSAPGGFYAGAEDYPGIIEQIAQSGSEVAGHGDVHRAFRDESLATQRARISDMLSVLNGILAPYGERVRGFRAPFLSHDLTTFEALTQLGLEYDSGEADVWAASTLPNNSDGIWQLPPSMPMDWHLFVEHDVSSEQAEAIFRDKLDYVIARRGLFSWLHHPWVIEPELDLVRALLSYATQRGDLWMARQDDILDWWTARERIELHSLVRSGGTVTAVIENTSPSRAIAGASVWIKVPADAMGIWAFRVDGVQLEPLLRQHGEQSFAVVVVPTLAPGEEETLSLWMGDGLFRDDFTARR